MWANLGGSDLGRQLIAKLGVPSFFTPMVVCSTGSSRMRAYYLSGIEWGNVIYQGGDYAGVHYVIFDNGGGFSTATGGYQCWGQSIQQLKDQGRAF